MSAIRLPAELARLPHVRLAEASPPSEQRATLDLGAHWSSVLPDGGLPCGAVIELSAPNGLGQSTSFALGACAAAQRESRRQRGESAVCAFLDPDRTLYAPAAFARGVDLGRLVVVRPPRDSLARVAVQLAQANVFAVIAIDVTGIPGAKFERGLAARAEPLSGWVNVTRKLSLAVERSKTTVLLLTDAYAKRPLVLPVAMRIELDQDAPNVVSARIAKERYGRVGKAHRVGWMAAG